jgi:hypothetical protein
VFGVSVGAPRYLSLRSVFVWFDGNTEVTETYRTHLGDARCLIPASAACALIQINARPGDATQYTLRRAALSADFAHRPSLGTPPRGAMLDEAVPGERSGEANPPAPSRPALPPEFQRRRYGRPATPRTSGPPLLASRSGCRRLSARSKSRRGGAWIAPLLVFPDRGMEDQPDGDGTRADRPQLAAALEFAREGDVLVVARLDRLARSMRQLLAAVDTLTARGISLRSLHENIDTTSATGRLILHIFAAALGQFEVELLRERTRTALAASRTPWPCRRSSTGAECHQGQGGDGMLATGTMAASDVARPVECNSSTLYRHVPVERSAVAEI